MNKTTLSGKLPKRKLVAEIITSILLLFFLHTLFSTYLDIMSLKNMLAFYTKSTAIVAWIIIGVEGIISLLLFFPSTRIVGLFAALSLLIFVGIVIINFAGFPHDFGGLFNDMPDKQRWLLIAGGISLAGTALLLSMSIKGHKAQKINASEAVFT